MKLVTYTQAQSAPQTGVLTTDETAVIVLQRGVELIEGKPSPFFQDMLSFLRGGVEARTKAWEVVTFVTNEKPAGTILPLDQVKLLAPVPRPESIRDCCAFEEHVINHTRATTLKSWSGLDRWIEKKMGRKNTMAYRANRTWYQRPLYHRGNPFSVVGPNADIQAPVYSQQLDYELEFGVFICKTGRNIMRKHAREHIGGYILYNDFSARDVEARETGTGQGPAKSKDFDTGNAMGPYLVTPDEVPDPYNLIMTARVNGEVWSRGTSSPMHWTFEDIISHISQSETLHPGEFIGSGPLGNGCGLELGRFLKPGDVIELEIQGLGILRNQIIREQTLK